MQTEVKKAWLRRSLAQDIKQKSRMTSSAGGGSCYYGGMMSHTTMHSVSLSVVTPRSLSVGGVVGSGGSTGGGSGLRPARHNSLYPQSSLSTYVAADLETPQTQQELTLQRESESFKRHVRASKGAPHSKSPEASLSKASEKSQATLCLWKSWRQFYNHFKWQFVNSKYWGQHGKRPV